MKLKTKVNSVNKTVVAEADLVSEGILNSLSVVFGVAAGRKLTITHFNAAHKSVCVEALKCVMNSLPQIRATCHGIANHALDMGATCLDIQKELEVYKNIMNIVKTFQKPVH